jgi:hypothetical protein
MPQSEILAPVVPSSLIPAHLSGISAIYIRA